MADNQIDYFKQKPKAVIKPKPVPESGPLYTMFCFKCKRNTKHQWNGSKHICLRKGHKGT